jgi:hypothetical protein
LSETIRRVRLEKLTVKKNCPARCSQPNGRRQIGTASGAVMEEAPAAETTSSVVSRSGCVRSSNG